MLNLFFLEEKRRASRMEESPPGLLRLVNHVFTISPTNHLYVFSSYGFFSGAPLQPVWSVDSRNVAYDHSTPFIYSAPSLRLFNTQLSCCFHTNHFLRRALFLFIVDVHWVSYHSFWIQSARPCFCHHFLPARPSCHHWNIFIIIISFLLHGLANNNWN